MACFPDCGHEIFLGVVLDSGKEVVERCAPDCRVLFAGASFEENQAGGGVLD